MNNATDVSEMLTSQLLTERIQRWKAFFDLKEGMRYYNDNYYKLQRESRVQLCRAKEIEEELLERGVAWKAGQIIPNQKIINDKGDQFYKA